MRDELRGNGSGVLDERRFVGSLWIGGLDRRGSGDFILLGTAWVAAPSGARLCGCLTLFEEPEASAASLLHMLDIDCPPSLMACFNPVFLSVGRPNGGVSGFLFVGGFLVAVDP